MTTPSTLPDTPNIIGGNALADAFGTGVHMSVGINKMLADIYNAWLRLGLGASTPDANRVLVGASPGVSSWTAGLTDAYINAAAAIAITKLAAVGNGNVLRSTGGVNVAGPIVAGDIAEGAVARKIAETILGSDAVSIVFSSIPATYRNLRLVVTGQTAVAATTDTLGLRMNGDTAGNYDSGRLFAGIAGASTFETVAASILQSGLIAGSTGIAGSTEIVLPDYARTNWRKLMRCHAVCVTANGAGGWAQTFEGGGWRSTAAITSITILSTSGSNLKAGTVATLYGDPL